MADKRNDITFRRIRGRIVPIKISKRQKKALEGTGLIVGGTLGALGAGILSGTKAKKSFKTRQLAFDFGAGRAGISAQEGLIPGHKAFVRSGRQAKFARGLGTIGRIGASAAIGLGVERFIEASGIETSQFGPEFASEFAGVGAATLVAAGFRKSASGKGFRKQALSGTRKLINSANLRRVAGALFRKKFGI